MQGSAYYVFEKDLVSHTGFFFPFQDLNIHLDKGLSDSFLWWCLKISGFSCFEKNNQDTWNNSGTFHSDWKFRLFIFLTQKERRSPLGVHSAAAGAAVNIYSFFSPAPEDEDVLFLQEEQSRELCTFQALLRTRGERCWGQVLGLNISVPSQGTCHHFRCPQKESLHQCWCLKMEIPSAGGEGMGTTVQISGNQLFIPSCFHPQHCLFYLSLSTRERPPWGAFVMWGMHGIKPPRCQRRGADAWATGPGVMGAFHQTAALTGNKYWQTSLCLRGCEIKNQTCRKWSSWILWVKWPEKPN